LAGSGSGLISSSTAGAGGVTAAGAEGGATIGAGGAGGGGWVTIGAGGVTSSVYGGLDFMTPVVELDFQRDRKRGER